MAGFSPQFVRDNRFRVRVAPVRTGQDGLDSHKDVATRAPKDDNLTFARMFTMASELVKSRIIYVFKVSCGVRACEAPRRSGVGID